MLESSPSPEAEPVGAVDGPLDPREARAAERLEAARRLRVIGMALAETLLERVSEQMKAREPVDAGAVALEFSRLSRATRQCLDLEARLDADGAALAKTRGADQAARRAEDEQARADRFDIKLDCVGVAVGEAIAAEARRSGDKARRKRLDARLREALEDPREEDAIANEPISALIERICGRLGVPVDWSLWDDEDWAVEERRAGLAASPYAARQPDPPGLLFAAPGLEQVGAVEAAGVLELASLERGAARGPP